MSTANPISPESKSIAVLPFVNRSSDPDNEYFSDGITEEIINALTKIQSLKVIARTSVFAFKGKNIDVRQIGRQLGVNIILEGSVRKAASKIRITAQLVRASDGFHLWSKRFDRQLEDIFELQDEISLLIADQIRENFGHFDLQEHLVQAPTDNITAYNLYLKGRFHQLRWNAEDIKLATVYYERSVNTDPQFALPYFGAGLSYGILASWAFMPYEEGIQKATYFLEKGQAINQENHLNYFAQATISLWGRWDFRTAHQQLDKAIALNPSFTDAREGLAELYTAIGEFEKAMQHTKQILNLNPLSPNHHYTKGNIYYLTGRYDEAIEAMNGALQIDPDFALALEVKAACYILKADYISLDDFLKTHTQIQLPYYCRALFKLMHEADHIAIDLSAIQSNMAGQNQHEAPASLIAWHLYLQVYLGHTQAALDALEEGIKGRLGQLINFQHDPFLKPLHAEPRYRALQEQNFANDRLPAVSLSPEKPLQEEQQRNLLRDREVDIYMNRLSSTLESAQPFLDPDLSLKGLADQLDIHPNKLSWLINERLGQNFNEYINSFRLEAFKHKALLPANAHLTLLAIAYESGFNSKTVFNTFFKKKMEMTPRAWVKSQL